MVTPIILGPKPVQATPIKNLSDSTPQPISPSGVSSTSGAAPYVASRSKASEPVNVLAGGSTTSGTVIKLINEQMELLKDHLLKVSDISIET
jgi:hypothetical protein